MNVENAPHNNTDVKLQNRMTFNHSHITIIFAPIIVFGFIVFGSWIIFFPHAYLAVVPWIIGSVLIIGGLAVVSALVAFGVHFIARPVVHLIQDARHSFTDARIKWHRRDYLESGPNHAAYLEKGIVMIKPVIQERHNHIHKPELPAAEPKQIEAPPLPEYVRYEDIKPLIPRGDTLVGAGPGGRPITKTDGMRALLWVVGGSGTGKSMTVRIRVEEDVEKGHRFLMIDPHAEKEDSLTKAVQVYSSRFIRPIAQQLEDINVTLQFFLDEFERRKRTPPPYQSWTIVIDEVGSLAFDIDPDEPLEVEVRRKLKEVARICGQEARGFRMQGIFISQDAAGLAWLRKRALLVIAHQTQEWSERLLVCNNDSKIAREMDNWPVGRTLAYGINFPPVVVQQPVITSRIVESFVSEPLPDLAPNPNSRASSNLNNGKRPEGSGKVPGRTFEGDFSENDLSVKKVLRDIGKKLNNGESRSDILRSLDATSGRANQEIGAVIDMMIEQRESEN